ncbi:MAG: 3-isopropylmalate dehydratase large subunit [Spirochaetia bacterium]|nr:3-isopropylmalate dehydratase large subunit [Spirochaetia bacterium]
MGRTLYDKVFETHSVQTLAEGQTQLFIDLHLLHEATSAPAFAMLKERNLPVMAPHRTFATVDHIIPTDNLTRPYPDEEAEEMFKALERNTAETGIRFFSPTKGEHGIVHVIGPEYGLTQPGMTICCGDSHTSTHGAFGAIAFGIGTSQVRDVMATQSLVSKRLKVRRIEINGVTAPGVTAKDVILHVIARLGVNGGVGFAYEFSGSTIEGMSMEERMTVCNMSIEAGARVGYINPDQKTYDYLRGRRYTPSDLDSAIKTWENFKSDPDAAYADTVKFDAASIQPMVSWGVNPGQSISVDGTIPEDDASADAREFMGFRGGQQVLGTRIDRAFIGSCTNGRLSDLKAVATFLSERGGHVAQHVKAIVVPGSQRVLEEAVELGLDKIFRDAGFEFRQPGCSMCLAMNPDKLVGNEVCASTSNRNFKGRQGSPTGRTLLMSPVMVAAAALAGHVNDARINEVTQ